MTGLVGLVSNAKTLAAGIIWCSSSSRFGPTSAFKVATPVTLPPGRFRVGTSPAATGSAPIAKMMGVVVVVAFAASAAAVLPGVAITVPFFDEPNRLPILAIDHCGHPPNDTQW